MRTYSWHEPRLIIQPGRFRVVRLLQALLMLGMSMPAIACEFPYCLDSKDGLGVELRPQFVVRLTHQEKPVAGINVVVSRYGAEKEGARERTEVLVERTND